MQSIGRDFSTLWMCSLAQRESNTVNLCHLVYITELLYVCIYALFRHLPLYLVAAFAKKLARLALSATATGKDVFQAQLNRFTHILFWARAGENFLPSMVFKHKRNR